MLDGPAPRTVALISEVGDPIATGWPQVSAVRNLKQLRNNGSSGMRPGWQFGVEQRLPALGRVGFWIAPRRERCGLGAPACDDRNDHDGNYSQHSHSNRRALSNVR